MENQNKSEGLAVAVSNQAFVMAFYRKGDLRMDGLTPLTLQGTGKQVEERIKMLNEIEDGRLYSKKKR